MSSFEKNKKKRKIENSIQPQHIRYMVLLINLLISTEEVKQLIKN